MNFIQIEMVKSHIFLEKVEQLLKIYFFSKHFVLRNASCARWNSALLIIQMSIVKPMKQINDEDAMIT